MLLIFTVMLRLSASGLALTPVYNQKVKNDGFEFSKKKSEFPEVRWQRDVGFSVNAVPLSTGLKSFPGGQHQTDKISEISYTELTSGTTNSIPGKDIRVKRNADSVLGASAENTTSNSSLPELDATETATSLATITELWRSSELPTALTSSPSTVAKASVLMTEPANVNSSLLDAAVTEKTSSLAPTMKLPLLSELPTTLASSPLTKAGAPAFITEPANAPTTETAEQTYSTEGNTTSDCPEISEVDINEISDGVVNISWHLNLENATSYLNACVEVISVQNHACEGKKRCTEEGLFVTVSSLCHFNSYMVTVLLECDSGDWRNYTQNFRTRTSVPSEPTKLESGTVTNTTIALQWSPPVSPNGNITNYTIYWAAAPGSESSDISEETTFVIGNLTSYTNYNISVSAWTSSGESKTRAGPLRIQTEEGIPTEPTNLTSGTVTNTTIDLQWSPPAYPNGKVTNYTVYWVATSGSEISGETQETFYTVNDLKPFTNYTLYVTAWTSAGESENRAGPLRIGTTEGLPDSPGNLTVTDRSNCSLTLEWSPPDISRGEITKYSVYWKKHDYEENYESNEANETTYELKNLMPYTNYTFKVSAWTAAGKGSSSVDVVGETLEGIPDPPEDLEFSDVSNQTLTLKWSPPSVIKGVITNYTVYWRNLDTAEDYQSATIDARVMQLEYLQPFTNYTAKVSAWTKIGQGLASEDKIQLTNEGLPGPPLNLIVQEGTDVSLNLIWSPPADPNGEIQRYDVSWSFLAEDGLVKRTENTSKTFFHIGDLKPYVNYTLAVSAWTSAGRGTWSSEKHYQMDVGVPSKAENVSVISTASDVLILSWHEPQDPHGPIDGYIINWKKTEEDRSPIAETNTSGDVTTYEFTGLTAFTNYTIWVTPYNINRKKEVLRSEDGDTVVAQTAEGIPTSPRELGIEEFTRTTFTVTWQDPETPNGKILVYTVHWQLEDGSAEMNRANTTNTRYVISNLYSFTKYNVTVSASTTAGEGPTTTGKLCKTDVGVPSAPRNGTVLDTSNTSILVQWKKPEFERGPIHGFIVRWRKHFSNKANDTDLTVCCHFRLAAQESCDDLNIIMAGGRGDPNATTPACRYLITDLDPWTNYTIQISAYNKNQHMDIVDGPPEVVEQATLAAVPEEPLVDRLDVLGSSSVFISWTYVGRFPGPLSYSVYLETDLSYPCTAKHEDKKTTGVRNGTAEIFGLRPFTYYRFQVVATTPAGSSKSRKTDPVRTGPAVSERPTNVRMDCSYSPTTASVRWRTPDRTNGLIEKYKIRYSLENGGRNYDEVVIKVVQSTSCEKREYQEELQNLHPEGIYEIEVMAKTKGVDRYGESARNNGYCFLPAGVPPFPNNNDTLLDVKETNQQDAKFAFSETTFSTEMGEIKYYAIIVALSHVIGKPINGSTDEAKNQTLPVWNQFWKQGSEIYQATPDNWNPFEDNEYDPLHCQRDPNSEKDLVYCTIGWEKNCSEEEPKYCNGPLKPGKRYGIKLRGFTTGGFSETSPIYISTAAIETANQTGTIVGLVFLFLLGIIIAVAIFLDKRKNYQTINRIRNFLRSKKSPDTVQDQEIGLSVTSISSNTAKTRPMDFASFLEHVKVMMSDSFLRFSLEYEEIKQTSPKHPCTAAEMEENRPKNRWMNIFPFDHSRVKLLPIDDEPSSDYINANYIPGFTSHREYIATQGPVPSTVEDFWRMVWEQGVTMIVMLTQCVERGKQKCEQYWPSDSDNVYYGDLKIQLKSESILSAYCIRIFDLQLGTKQHTVKQMHFTKWPDFGSPESPEDLINFVQAVRDHLPHTNTGPILVHCSAGVGRTGTFIAVDRLLQHIQYHNEINIYNIVVEMRQYRTNMVQTEDQYIYIHKCMRDIISQKLNPRGSIYDEDSDDLYSNIGSIPVTEL